MRISICYKGNDDIYGGYDIENCRVRLDHLTADQFTISIVFPKNPYTKQRGGELIMLPNTAKQLAYALLEAVHAGVGTVISMNVTENPETGRSRVEAERHNPQK